MFRKRTFQDRLWEILPGLQFWLVFFCSIILSYQKPVWAALFIICFDLYWVLKAVNVATHLMASYFKFQVFVTLNWIDFVKKLSNPQELISDLNAITDRLKSKREKKYLAAEIHRLEKIISSGQIGRAHV